MIERISAHHYRIESFTHTGIFYDLHYNEQYGRWVCPCKDSQGPRHNGNCKHRLALIDHIHAEISARQQEQQLRQDMRAAAKIARIAEAEAYLRKVSRMHLEDIQGRERAEQQAMAERGIA